MTNPPADHISLREFFEWRLSQLDEKFDRIDHQFGEIKDALERLSSALIGREYFEALATEINELNEQQRKQDDEIDDLRRRVEEQEKNPSLVWLLRYRTKETIATIILIFVILSLLYISDFRIYLLKLAGLPLP